MKLRLTLKPGYLEAEVTGRATAQETREYLAEVWQAAKQHRTSTILISLKKSAGLFKVESFGLSGMLDVARAENARIALTGDTRDVRLSQQYIELLARQRDVALKAFDDEDAAIAWLVPRTRERNLAFGLERLTHTP